MILDFGDTRIVKYFNEIKVYLNGSLTYRCVRVDTVKQLADVMPVGDYRPRRIKHCAIYLEPTTKRADRLLRRLAKLRAYYEQWPSNTPSIKTGQVY
jgi:hypothetical protein